MSDPVTIARTAWGEDMPDWIRRLSEESDATSQNKVAARLGRSAALVSNVLRRKYKGDMAAVEALVRDVLMPVTVSCPVLGEITTSTCREWMGRARTYNPINSEYVRMFRACNGCARYQKGKKQ